MKTRISSAILLLAAGSAGLAQGPDDASPAATSCGVQGLMTFLCGIEAAEDIAPIPGTRWLLAGGLGFGRPATIKLIDTVDGTVRSIYPDPAANRPQRRAYADCPGPADPAQFSTGGVALQSLSRHKHLFYAVHDGARKSVEVFEIDSKDAQPTLVWVGCIPLPEGTNANAVAPLKHRGVAIVSMDDGAVDRMERHVAGQAGGTVYEWHPRTGLRQLDDIRLRGGNGIVVSPDERWLYVSAWSGAQIVRIRRDGSMPPHFVALDYLPDNLKWADDGSILVAGQRPPVSAIARCTGDACLDDWLIALIDPETLASTTIIEARGTAAVNYATGAAELDGSLYITNRGSGGIGVLRKTQLRRDGVIRVDD